jgi:hypothetical protein
MVTTYYQIFPHDSVYDIFVLWDATGPKLELNAEYRDLQCQKCKKIDEKAALRRGLFPKEIPRTSRPFCRTCDGLYLLNRQAFEIFETIIPDKLDAFKLPGSDFYIASAKDWFLPQHGDLGVRFSRDQCKLCGRFREMTWSKNPPTIPGIDGFIAVNIESIRGAREIWIVSEDVANTLRSKKSQLTGISFSPKPIEISTGASI